MDETPNLGLPLVSPAQAQKHVTVNEALMRIDALAQLTVASRSTRVPPDDPDHAGVWAVAEGAADAWAGQVGRLALWLNGGWMFIDPRPGWRAWVTDEGVLATWNGVAWSAGAGAMAASGAGTLLRVLEIDHDILPGPVSMTDAIIPAHAIVFGVTARVLEDIGGNALSWRLGVEGSDDRYGSGYGTTAGSWARGLTSAPLAYWVESPLLLTAEGADFSGGRVRLAVHLAELTLPRG